MTMTPCPTEQAIEMKMVINVKMMTRIKSKIKNMLNNHLVTSSRWYVNIMYIW